MFKEGVRDILEKLDDDLVGLIPVKLRVRQIAALLVLDKVRCPQDPAHPPNNAQLVHLTVVLRYGNIVPSKKALRRSSVAAGSEGWSTLLR